MLGSMSDPMKLGRGLRRGTVSLPIIIVLLQIPGAPQRHDGLEAERQGTLEGFVRLAGEGRALPTQVANTTDPEVCGRQHSLEDLVVSVDDRGIRYVTVAFLDVHTATREAAPSPQRLEVDNRECRFAPHTAVAMVGDTIVAKNSDAVLHTTHYYGPLSSNVALPAPMSVSRVVRRPGIITVLCDVHGWMKAFIRVDDHPFHDVTDESGFFEIDAIPPGSYVVEFWHEKLGTQQVQVQIESGETAHIEVVYSLADSDVSS